MKNLLIAKIIRNPERIEIWEWCKQMVKDNPNEFRIKYKDMDFYLEKLIKLGSKKIWIRTLKSITEM